MFWISFCKNRILKFFQLPIKLYYNTIVYDLINKKYFYEVRAKNIIITYKVTNQYAYVK